MVAVANYLPELSSKLYRSFVGGRLSDASRIQLTINYVWHFMGRYNQIAAVKALTRLRGVPAGYPRRPILPLDDVALDSLRKLLASIDIL